MAAGALLAGLGVAFGAFGAHALKDALSAEALAWWQVAVQYQMWHALALLAIGAAARPGSAPAAWAIGAGILIFAGSLYAMALGGPRWLGMVTPLGGAAMIGGWAWLGWRLAFPPGGSGPNAGRGSESAADAPD